MHDSDCVDELLPNTDADDPDPPKLMRERRELLAHLQDIERLASPDSRHGPRQPGSIHRASAPLSYLPDAACEESSTSALRVFVLEDDPATQEVFSILLAPEEEFEMTDVSEVATCLEYLPVTSTVRCSSVKFTMAVSC
jgi:hypothetical protein